MLSMNVKYLIVGAGAAGLSFAATLKKHGEESFVLLEKEHEAGGLCRSVACDGAPLDIGGGHILDARNKAALDFVFSFLPEDEWKLYERKTKIVIGGHRVDYPLESNLWQFPLEIALDYIESIAKLEASRSQDMPERFTDWITWKFGDKIAREYMMPYNQKIWSRDLDALGTYWLGKFPDVSFREILSSCLSRVPNRNLPHIQFYYPKKYGYGEVFLRVAKSIKEHIRYGYAVNDIDCAALAVNGEYHAQHIINTAPWHEFSQSLPAAMQGYVNQLKFSSLDVDYYPEVSGYRDSYWTYFADINLPYHRIIHRDNVVEGARGYWTETNSLRRKQPGAFHWEAPYAYPLPTLGKPEAISKLLEAMEGLNIFGLGRWGQWDYINSDIAIVRGIALAEKMLAKG